MSLITDLQTAPRDRYEAASVAGDTPQHRARTGERLRGFLSAAAICLLGMGLIAFKVWVYLPASIHHSLSG